MGGLASGAACTGAGAAAGTTAAAEGWGRVEGAGVGCLLVLTINLCAYVSGTLGAAGCGGGASSYTRNS